MRFLHFKKLSKGFLIVVALATLEGISPNISQCTRYGVLDVRMAIPLVFQGLPLLIDEESDGDDVFTRWNTPLGSSPEDHVCVREEIRHSVAGTPVPEYREYVHLTPRSPPHSLV